MLQLQPLSGAASNDLFTLLRTQDGHRAHYPDVTEPGTVPGRPDMMVTRMQPVDRRQFRLARLERHPHCNQTFIPLHAQGWLIAVAPSLADGTPDLAGITAWLAGPADAICLHRTAWHASLTVFDSPAEFVMMMWRATAAADTEYFDLANPLALA